MAITSDNQKMAVMAFNNVFMPPVYMYSTSNISSNDKWQLLWHYPVVREGVAAIQHAFVEFCESVFARVTLTESLDNEARL